ncbi:MAG: hypothetical protein KC503_08840 [Myxococcales bacterium]|nr:hypothetical protein [Myxococcales bacterium]
MLALALSAAAAAYGCAAPNPIVSLAPPAKAPVSDSYPDQLRRWTRFGRIIKQLDTPLKVHATLFAPEFASAYVSRYSDLFKLPPAKRAKLAEEQRKSWETSFPLVFAAATHDWTWNDFDRKDSVWRVALVNDGGAQVSPQTIKRVRRQTATTKSFFPYVAEFYEVYEVRFPRALPDGRALVDGDTKSLLLRFAGPLGQTELTWKLR